MGELLTGEKVDFNEVDEEGMNVLTNTKRMYGAVGILTESIQKSWRGNGLFPVPCMNASYFRTQFHWKLVRRY